MKKTDKIKCKICGQEADSDICSVCAWEYEEPPEWYGGE